MKSVAGSHSAGSRCAFAMFALVLASCASVPVPQVVMLGEAPQDPRRYETCEDPVARERYEAALERLQADDEQAALPLLEEVVRRCPDNVLAMGYYQDAALHLGGDAERAMRSHYESLPADAASPVPAFAKARLLASNFARKGAIESILERHPEFAYAWMAQGRLLRGIGRLPDAVASFQNAIARHPRLLAAHLEMAECLAESGREREAQSSYENYLRAAPNDRATVRAYVQLALYRNGNAEAARPWVERLLAEDPQDESVRMDLAACDWRSGRLAEALDGYLRALERRPENARALLNIGYLHFDAFARSDEARRVHWPKARAAFVLFLQTVRPADGYDYFERSFAVPFRMKQIDELLGPASAASPTLADLR